MRRATTGLTTTSTTGALHMTYEPPAIEDRTDLEALLFIDIFDSIPCDDDGVGGMS